MFVCFFLVGKSEILKFLDVEQEIMSGRTWSKVKDHIRLTINKTTANSESESD